MKNKKRLFIILFVTLIIISLLFMSYIIILKQDFKIVKFKDVVEYNYQENIVYNSGDVYYGNKIKSHKVKVEITKNIDEKIIGEHTVTYTYKYKNHTLVKKQTIKIIDNEKPIIEVDDEEYKFCPDSTDIKINAKAIDNYDGDISDKIKQELKGNEVILTVEDSSKNESTLSKEIKLIDESEPTLTLNGSNSIYVALNGIYKELGAKAIDNCDGDISKNIVKSGSVDTTKSGEYKITYTVKDKSGNKKSITRKVYVYQKNNYSTPTGKSIYLTFDDGPSSYTGKLLDVLKKYNVPATFFVTNQSITRGYDSMILRAYNEGHTIGLHSYTHDYSNIYKNSEAYFNDLYEIQNKVKIITGYTSNIIRFPGGSSNTVSKKYDGGQKIMSELTKAVEAKGFRYWDWNISSGDASGTSSKEKVATNIIKGLGNGSTYVVLQHDTKGFSVDAVEEVIMYGLSHGYTFKSLTMNSPTVHHSVSN